MVRLHTPNCVASSAEDRRALKPAMICVFSRGFSRFSCRSGIGSSGQLISPFEPCPREVPVSSFLPVNHAFCLTATAASIDLLGFGESPAGADYTIEEYVAAIAATIRSLRLRAPFTLVGHSLGALLSSRFAAQYPAQVSHLVMVSPPIYPDPAKLNNRVGRMQLDAYLRAYEYLRTNKTFTIAHAPRVSAGCLRSRRFSRSQSAIGMPS